MRELKIRIILKLILNPLKVNMVEVKTNATIEGLDVLNTLTDIMKEAFGTEIAGRLKENIVDSIENEIFLSNLGFKSQGIVDLGTYKKSIETDDTQSPNIFLVGSTDEKAKSIEQGTSAEQNRGLKDHKIIAWAKRKRVGGRRYISVGRKIARYIRRNGIREKPAFRIGIDRTKGDQEEIKNRTISRLKSRLNR